MASKPSKRIFSLRLNEDIRQALLDVADRQGTTITAIINRYIFQGLKQDDPSISVSEESGSRVIQPNTGNFSSGKVEELLFQILQNQRLIEMSIDGNQQSLDTIETNIEKLNAVKT